MPLSACAGILFVLLGLGGVGIGIAIGQLRELRSPAVMRLWLIGWAMGGLALVCLGVITVRYAKGLYVSVPASAPLIDRVLWVLVPVGGGGFFAHCLRG
jgi:hypothetical protein